MGERAIPYTLVPPEITGSLDVLPTNQFEGLHIDVESKSSYI